ncbi:FAD-binding oxidoreductase [Halorhodospira halophila]|nr:FAD-binding oxidoreductase [Halorhodospira halophila]
MSKTSAHPLAEALRARLGAADVLTEPARIAPYMTEQRGQFPGQGRLVARPADTDEVAATVTLCRQHGATVVAQSGNTGTVGGGSPRHGDEVVLSLERMQRIRSLDADDGLLIAEAGCTLADLQEAAAAAQRFFPLSLASEAQCRIGGNLATNAGGLNVLRYGNARNLTLGLEVVLADGRVWSDLRGLRKDNSGYDLRDLFIGSEGTLGIITAAALRLLPPPRSRRVALLALPRLEPALALVRTAQAESGDAVVGAELMSAEALGMGQRLDDTPENPLPGSPWYLLLELATADPRADLDEALAAALEPAEAAGDLADALLAPTEAAAERLWRLRTAIPDGQKRAGASIKHDISVRPGYIAAFVPEALAAVTELDPAVRPCIFGHVGDGNLHFNLSQPEHAPPEAFQARAGTFHRAVHDVVRRFGGSVAAEHGVGQLKRDEVARCADPVGLELMHRIKHALDPENLLNPGKGAAAAHAASAAPPGSGAPS